MGTRCSSSAPFDFNGLDTAVHGPVRLGVLAALGALGMHLQKLEEAGYIGSTQGFVGRRPKTTYRITIAGRQALLGYLRNMQRLAGAVGL
ncbi:MAG: transcriptional regulator [Acidobacteriia bacterium]|nr:transcriptional regulator [Terriglobia bacterium]